MATDMIAEVNRLERIYGEMYQRKLQTLSAVSDWFHRWHSQLPAEAAAELNRIVIPMPESAR